MSNRLDWYTYTCKCCGKKFHEMSGGIRTICTACKIENMREYSRRRRERMREENGKKTMEENVEIAKRIIDQYIGERGLKTVINSKDIEFWAREKNIIPPDWDYVRTMVYISRGITSGNMYTQIGKKQYGLVRTT